MAKARRPQKNMIFPASCAFPLVAMNQINSPTTARTIGTSVMIILQSYPSFGYKNTVAVLPQPNEGTSCPKASKGDAR